MGARNNTTKEPVFYHSYPVTVYKELLRAFPCHAVIDLTPGVNIAVSMDMREGTCNRPACRSFCPPITRRAAAWTPGRRSCSWRSGAWRR